MTVAVAAIEIHSVGREANGLFVTGEKPDFTHCPSLVERRCERFAHAFGLDRRGAEAVCEHDEAVLRFVFDDFENLRVALLQEHCLGRFERQRRGNRERKGDAYARVEPFGGGFCQTQFKVVPDRFRVASAHRTSAAFAKK